MTADSVFQRALGKMLIEIFEGPPGPEAYVLNPGDPGLLRQLDSISAQDASTRPMPGKTTIAAHADHVNYGLSLMNRWATEGGDPFADAKWDEAWKTSRVDDRAWAEIRNGLRDEAHRWLQVLGAPREVRKVELSGMIASIAHLAYHLGAMRQIATSARGPREGTFA